MNESGRTRFYLDKTGFFAESAVILDLVMRETGLTGGNVKIIPVK